MLIDAESWLPRRVHTLLRAVGGEEYSRLGEFVEGEEKYRVDSLQALGAQIDGVLETLSQREQQAVMLRFGLDDGRSKTLKEAGRQIGVTGERVRQLEAVALDKLREPPRRAALPRALH